MMITTNILSVISDLLVTKLINSTLLPDKCQFDQGLVVNVRIPMIQEFFILGY